jgi:hypothetical protein
MGKRLVAIASVVTSKAANGGHPKTGQRARRSSTGYLLLYLTIRQAGSSLVDGQVIPPSLDS